MCYLIPALLNSESNNSLEGEELARPPADFSEPPPPPKFEPPEHLRDAAFLSKIAQPDGLYDVEKEIAEDADIDPKNVYVDYPDRLSVSFYPGKYPIDELLVFERGSRGYELWPITEHSLVARSFQRTLKPIRVYTTRGYRSKVKKVADDFLESVDTKTQC